MVFKGQKPVLMAGLHANKEYFLIFVDLLTHPTRSIVTQSYASKERIESNLNGDGFGVGWYTQNHIKKKKKKKTKSVSKRILHHKLDSPDA